VKNIFVGLQVKCCNHPTIICVCGDQERILRGFMREDASLPPMTAVQREWCLNEIGSVEGYDRKDYEHYTNADLASAVLNAWSDYCQDKDLL
jgi:hypothetical protein